MRFGRFKFGSIQIDGVTYEYDVVIDGGSIRKRKKKPSKPFRNAYGHTPLSAGGGYSPAMPAAGGWYGSPRRAADHGGGCERGSGAPG